MSRRSAPSRRACRRCQVACFDTAFHATQPVEATRFALPLDFWERGLRRYGFHGLSYEAVVARFTALTGEVLPPRTIVAHLANGASLCAIREDRKSTRLNSSH